MRAAEQLQGSSSLAGSGCAVACTHFRTGSNRFMLLMHFILDWVSPLLDAVSSAPLYGVSCYVLCKGKACSVSIFATKTQFAKFRPGSRSYETTKGIEQLAFNFT